MKMSRRIKNSVQVQNDKNKSKNIVSEEIYKKIMEDTQMKRLINFKIYHQGIPIKKPDYIGETV